MTTDELVAELKSHGVSDSDAEGMRDLHIKSKNVGQRFQLPTLTGPEREGMVYVTAYFTGEDKEYVPDWESVHKAF